MRQTSNKTELEEERELARCPVAPTVNKGSRHAAKASLLSKGAAAQQVLSLLFRRHDAVVYFVCAGQQQAARRHAARVERDLQSTTLVVQSAGRDTKTNTRGQACCVQCTVSALVMPKQRSTAGSSSFASKENCIRATKSKPATSAARNAVARNCSACSSCGMCNASTMPNNNCSDTTQGASAATTHIKK